MASIIAGEAAKKGSGIASNALTGDVYVRRWTSTKGKGKKKREVNHEVHVNPLTLAVGAAAAGAAALAAGFGLWAMQKKVTATEGKQAVRIVDIHDPVYETVTIVDTAGYWDTPVIWTTVTETLQVQDHYLCNDDGSTISATESQEAIARWLLTHRYHDYTVIYRTETITKLVSSDGEPVWIPPVTHTEEQVKTDGYALVRTQKGGLPVKIVRPLNGPFPANEALSAGERARGWYIAGGYVVETADWGTRWHYNIANNKKKTYGLGDREGFGVDIGF